MDNGEGEWHQWMIKEPTWVSRSVLVMCDNEEVVLDPAPKQPILQILNILLELVQIPSSGPGFDELPPAAKTLTPVYGSGCHLTSPWNQPARVSTNCLPSMP